MSIYEYDEEKHMRQTREEGYEDGYDDGLAAGHESGYKDGLATGIITLIQTCQKLLLSKQEVEQIISERFSLSDQEVHKWMEKHWVSDKK